MLSVHVDSDDFPTSWCFCRVRQPHVSRLPCSKPDVLLGLTQSPNVDMREEEHDDHVFPGDS